MMETRFLYPPKYYFSKVDFLGDLIVDIRQEQMTEVVAIIGASDKPERFSNMAIHELEKHGHDVVLVNPFKEQIDGNNCFNSVDEFKGKIDTITLYVNPARFRDHIEEVIKARPRRVIFNPGTEDDMLEKLLTNAGIYTQRACTLVLLSTNSF